MSVPEEGRGGTSWSVRPYRSGDEQGIARLFERVRERPFDLENWRWKVLGRAQGIDSVWLAVDPDDRPIFHIAGIPVNVEGPAQRWRALINVDAMTDPDYRRQGVLTAVAKRAYASWRNAGFDLVLGLPNEQWGSRTRALGWHRVGDLRWQVRLLRLESELARRLGHERSTFSRWLARQRVLSWLWDALWRLTEPRPGGLLIDVIEANGSASGLQFMWRSQNPALGVVHDRSWLQWRYLDQPKEGYRILVARRERPVATVCYRVKETEALRMGIVAEVNWAPGEQRAARTLLGEAARRSHAAGATALFALAVPGSQSARLLWRSGFILRRRSFPVCVIPLSGGVDPSAVQEQRWNLQGGDFDVL